MSQQEKARYFRALKDAGVEFSKHYREYSTAELKQSCDKIIEQDPDLAVKVGLISAPPSAPQPQMPPATPNDGFGEQPSFDADALNAAYEEMIHPTTPRPAHVEPAAAPQPGPMPDEMAGVRQNTNADLTEVVHVDEFGRQWFQLEVRKPSFPKPRGRRVLKYMDSGVERQQIKVGDYVEEFEVAGTGPGRTSEVKVTLPSYQVGIYKDPRFPFRVHCYNGVEGFDLFEVRDFYGGAELVPEGVKRIYVENVLCYDIRTTVRAIETEYRQQQLAGRIQ